MRRLLVRVAALSAAVLLTAGCTKIGGTGDLDYIAGDGAVVPVKVADRGKPVEISGRTVQGQPLDVADLRGQVVVLNVWWSGCGPCRKEMPMLVDAQKEFEASDPGAVAFVGINIRDLAPENAASFERDRGVDYPSLYDPGSETLLALGKYAPPYVPATVVLDKQGRVAALINGVIPSKTTLTTVVEEALREPSGKSGA